MKKRATVAAILALAGLLALPLLITPMAADHGPAIARCADPPTLPPPPPPPPPERA
jgi:hypothetical protein